MNDEVLEGAEIGRDAAQQKIDLAGQHVAVPHDGRASRPFFEGNEIGFGLAVQSDHGECRDFEAKRLVVQKGGEAGDDAGLFERPSDLDGPVPDAVFKQISSIKGVVMARRIQEPK